MCRADYEKYEYLIGMDDRNISNMIRIAGGDPAHKIYKLLMFADDPGDIADPWYTGEDVYKRQDLYRRFSRMAHEIYAEYTDKQEPYGIDECWLDVTGSSSLKGDGLLIAQEISKRMKSQLGITVSVGVSFNKIFAKLGSDYKKPDAITTMYKLSLIHIFSHTHKNDTVYFSTQQYNLLYDF